MASAYVDVIPPCAVCGGPMLRLTKYGICWRTGDCQRKLRQLSRKAHPRPTGPRPQHPNAARHRKTWREKNPESWRRQNPLDRAIGRAKSRAKKKGVPFALTREDLPPVPERCPILGIELIPAVGAPSPNSPALDRIIPARGYVPGNIQWLSHRANFMKNDASPEELVAFARWVLGAEGSGLTS